MPTFDPTASLPANYITNEVQSSTDAALFPLEGNFFLNDLVVESRPDNTSPYQVLTPGVGYFLGPLHLGPSAAIGREIFTYVVVTTGHIDKRITYRAAGAVSDSTLSAEILASTIDRTDANAWRSIQGQQGTVKPYATDPSLRGLSFLEVVSQQLESLRIAIETTGSNTASSTTVTEGITRYATAAETTALTIGTAAITPSGLAPLANSLDQSTDIVNINSVIGTIQSQLAQNATELVNLRQSIEISHNAADITERDQLLSGGTVDDGENVFVVDAGGGEWALYRRVSGAWIELSNQAALNTLTINVATTAQQGIIEIASTAETLLLSDSTRAVTPFGLGQLVTSRTQRGLPRQATASEVSSASSVSAFTSPEDAQSIAQNTINANTNDYQTGTQVSSSISSATGSFLTNTQIQTLINDAILQSDMNKYKVGALFFGPDPVADLGFGTWVRVGGFIAGVDPLDPDYNQFLDLGGSKTHTHNIQVPADGWTRQTTNFLPEPTDPERLIVGTGNVETGEQLESITHAVADRTVTSTQGSNLPPFTTVNIWRRTA